MKHTKLKNKIAENNRFISWSDFVTSAMIGQVTIKDFEKVINELIESEEYE